MDSPKSVLQQAGYFGTARHSGYAPVCMIDQGEKSSNHMKKTNGKSCNGKRVWKALGTEKKLV